MLVVNQENGRTLISKPFLILIYLLLFVKPLVVLPLVMQMQSMWPKVCIKMPNLTLNLPTTTGTKMPRSTMQGVAVLTLDAYTQIIMHDGWEKDERSCLSSTLG